MKGSKLIQILSTFSPEEINSFEKFICSPYFSRGRDVTGLFSVLKKYYPGFDAEKIEKISLFNKAFPHEAFNEKKLKNLVFDLNRLAEQFLIHNSVKTDSLASEKILAAQLRKRRLERSFVSSMGVIEKILTEKLFDGRYYFDDMEDYSTKMDDFLFWKSDFDNSIKYRVKATEYAALTFLIKLLQRIKDKEVVTKRFGKKFENELFDGIVDNINFDNLIKELKDKNYNYTWLIEIYYYSTLCFLEDDKSLEPFKKMRDIFYDHITFFSHHERHMIFHELANYCMIRKEKGDPDFIKEEFSTYSKMIEFYSTPDEKDEFFHAVLFRNIIISALLNKQYDWIEKFSHNFIPLLKPERRESMRYYVDAHLAFERKDFHKALDNLNSMNFDLILNKFDVRNLMLKIYYELELYDQAQSYIDAYRHFLADNKEIARIHYEQYNNFIGLYSKLLKAKENQNIDVLDTFENYINNTDKLASRIWLTEKINELKSPKFAKKHID